MQRDFVIQIRRDADVQSGRFEGRVEHIESGRSAHFASSEELVRFIIRAIAAQADEPQNLTSL